MSDNWLYVLLEIGLFVILGVLYYFYQKRKIIRYEAQKAPMLMGFVLESFLSERGENPDPQMDAVISALDDYLHNRSANPPTALLKHFSESQNCSEELKHIIREALAELD